MDRKELAIKMFNRLKSDEKLLIKDASIWETIATTDDVSLLSEYERLCKGGTDNNG